MTPTEQALKKIDEYDHLTFEMWLAKRPLVTRLIARACPPDRIYRLGDEHVIIDGYQGEQVWVMPIAGGEARPVHHLDLEDVTASLRAPKSAP